MTPSTETGRRGFDGEVVAIIEGATRELWICAVVFFVGGDLLTTGVGLLAGGVVEVGPVVGPLIEAHGLVAMVPLKLFAVGIGYLIWRVTPAPHDVGVPLGLAVLGVLVTAWNTGVLVLSVLLV